MSLIVGIDAGGSSIECAIERNGLLSHASGAGANVRTIGAGEAGERVAAALSGALRGDHPDAIVIGAAGAGDPELAAELRGILERRFDRARVAVYDDAAIAMRAAAPSGDGIVLIAGTGSIACGFFGDAVYRAGGYGALAGDEGSGFAIGRAALALALRAFDGRAPQDPLASAVASRFEAANAPELIARVYAGGDPVATIASLAPLVLECAGNGERSASKIVQTAAGDLVELVKAVVKQAQAASADVPLVFAGGMLANNSLLSYLIETRLTADFPLFVPVKSAPAPVLGALALARRLAEA